MYCLYIPKYEKDAGSALNLPRTLGHFMSFTEFSYDLLISPGYMSYTNKTIPAFLAEIENEIAAGAKEEVGLGLFHGMNGHKPTRGSTRSVLDEHTAAIMAAHHFKDIKISSKKQNDHRKMIFFFARNDWNMACKLDKKSMDDFLKKIKVKAILIGSSNFSYSTYYNYSTKKKSWRKNPAKGEADLLMFCDDKYKYEEVAKEGIEEAIRLESESYSLESESYSLESESYNREPEKIWSPKMILSKNIVEEQDTQKFFEDILRDFLEHSLA